MPRFVILEHDHPVLHWDLMLEAGDALQTWRLAKAPECGLSIEATEIGDHRIAYLDYEGPVSGNRGMVRRWDHGEFREETDATSGVRRLHLRGERVQGDVMFERVHGASWRWTWV